MSGMEALVRPFETPNTLATRRIIASNVKIAIAPVVKSWGVTGTLPAPVMIETPGPPDPTDFTVLTCDDNWSETERTTTPVRIGQTGSPENFVVVDRIDQIAFEKGRTSAASKVATSYSTSWSIGSDYRVVQDDNKACKSRYTLAN